MNGTHINHAVHISVIDFFLTEQTSAENPKNVNQAIILNRTFAEGDYRCLHTNGNHTVWEGPKGIVNVSRCELPTLTVSPRES
jgi:hypothetical protein